MKVVVSLSLAHCKARTHANTHTTISSRKCELESVARTELKRKMKNFLFFVRLTRVVCVDVYVRVNVFSLSVCVC